MSETLQARSPFSGEVVAEVPRLELSACRALVGDAAQAQRAWRRVPLADRLALVERFLQHVVIHKETIAREITLQMGKPLGQARAEVDGMLDRARYMASIAADALADVALPDKPGFVRRVVREPLGVVLCIAPWNYPLLTAVNVVVPAVLAGNAVLLKHAPQTPRCGEVFAQGFSEAGAPRGLVTAFQASHAVVDALIAEEPSKNRRRFGAAPREPGAASSAQSDFSTSTEPGIAHVAFTGSVRGGLEVARAASARVLSVGLELGGKDPAYVAADADFEHAVEGLVDGAFYNAGQSCCGIERIYVHRSIYARFVDAAVAQVRRYALGDPLDPATTLGPMALERAPALLAEQVAEAADQGGRVCCGGAAVQVGGKGRFFTPTVVADAPQGCALMQQESFGPVVGIAAVEGDDEAILRMNDSRYGLTAAVYTADLGRAERMAAELQAGTVFMNRCDFLDPALPWVGVKDSGLGATLGHEGFMRVSRAKSLHFRLRTR